MIEQNRSPAEENVNAVVKNRTVTKNTVQMRFHLFMIFDIFRDSLRTR